MLGDRIAALRKEAGLSQAALAKKIGVSPSTVGMYEQGRREPALDTLLALAAVFSVSTDYLLTGQTGNKEDDLAEICRQVLAGRRKKPILSQDELVVLMAAMLSEG